MTANPLAVRNPERAARAEAKRDQALLIRPACPCSKTTSAPTNFLPRRRISLWTFLALIALVFLLVRS